MKKLSNKLGLMCLFITLITLLSGCSSLDVVGQGSITSFEAVLDAIPDQLAADNEKEAWSLTAPDRAVRLVWSTDYSSNNSLYDIFLEFDATPFIEAGLDLEKLPSDYLFTDNKLLVGVDLGDTSFEYSGDITPLSSYEQLERHYRNQIGYHMDMDHYNINLSNGNMFEWAKDLDINTVSNTPQDKDIVFVLNPEPFINAGVAPENVDGWIYTTVNVDMNGKAMDVYKFLKPFDLQ